MKASRSTSTRAGTSLVVIDVLHGLMQRVPCFTLAYSDLHDAAELFLDRFAVPFSGELMIDLNPSRFRF